MTWGTPAEVTALGLLLDRTWAETADAGARPHRLDRPFLVGQFDLWITHLRPAAAAAAGPLRSRRTAARNVWRSLDRQAQPEHRRWLRAHLNSLGVEAEQFLGAAGEIADSEIADSEIAELPAGPGAGRLADLCTTQYLIFRMLRRMRYLGHLRRWELAAAGELCAGLGAKTIRAAGTLGTSRRERRADHLLRSLVEDSEGLPRTYLSRNAGVLDLVVPAAGSDPPGPQPVRITVGTAERLFDRLDVSEARLRCVEGDDPMLIQLDLRRADEERETIAVLTLHGPEHPAAPLAPADGLAVLGVPLIEATADEIAVSIPLAGGDWTVRASAGAFYTD